MNYGLHLSASGVLTSMYRQDVYANNLANSETVAFKPDFASVLRRAPESQEGAFGLDLRHDLLDRLGGGVFAGSQRINFDTGTMQKTGNPLDLAIENPTSFFAVSAMDPNSGKHQVMLTRDGRLTRNEDNYLITVAGGHRVLDPADKPIQLPVGPLAVNRSGQISQGDVVVGQVQISKVTDEQALTKQGQNLFKIDGPRTLRQMDDEPSVLSGFIEASGTDPITELMDLIDASKSATSNANLIRYHDLLLDRAVNTLGRVLA